MNIDTIHKGRFGFIIGSGRSGTTLLTKIINSHKDICAPTAENYFLIAYLYHFTKKKTISIKDIEFIVDNLWHLNTVHQYVWKINYSHLKKILKTNLSRLDFNLLMKVIFAHFNGNTKKDDYSFFFDKNPFYIDNLKKIHSVFPKAKYIFIVRDYRGKYNSIKKVRRWFIPAFGISWYIQHEKILDFFTQNPEQSLLIRYEDLTSHPEKTIQEIISFLNLSPDANMLRHFEISKTNYSTLPIDKYNKQNQLKWHKNSDNPINAKSNEKWKTELSDKEIKMLDYYCGKTGKLFEYEPIYKEFSIWEKLLIEFQYRPLFILIHGFPKMKKLFFKLPLHFQYKIIKLLKILLSKQIN